LGNLPETPSSAQFEKYRLRFIIEILCLLGLRVGELTTHTWNAFREEEGAWWFFVLGKGDKPGKIPVNEELLSAIKRYRLFMGLSPLPNPEDTIPIITPWHGKKPISSSHINKALKRLAIQTADIYFANQPYKHEKLKGFSAHWLRHLSASMQDQAGISFTIIQANMRHKSGETTRQYIHAMDRKRHEEMNKIKLKV